ncbi:hypothetical protein YB2330_004884 [Saitoella coloradoensis]
MSGIAFKPSMAADFSLSVLPDLHQITDPAKLATMFTDPRQFWVQTNPLLSAFVWSMVLSVLVFAVSEVNDNYSQVDRLWPFLPTGYTLHFLAWAYYHGLDSPRLWTLAGLHVVWTCRLFWNYYRKGGYSKGSEDYRWPYIRKNWRFFSNPTFFRLFNFVFISIAQNLLHLAIATPAYIVLLVSRDVGPRAGDAFAVEAFVLSLFLEGYADEQQWEFQSMKKKFLEYPEAERPEHLGGFTRKPLERGFNTHGLFAWSRHPNFIAEQLIWISFYAIGCTASGVWLNWTIVGCLSYCILFQCSTRLTEEISCGKYPAYQKYQKRVGMFFPTGKSWDEAVDGKEE